MRIEINQNVASRIVLKNSQKEKFPYEINVFDLRIIVMKNVFSPKYFKGWKIFTRNFPDVKDKDVLEIGAGTGVTAIYLAKNGANKVLATDINPFAVHNIKVNIKKNRLKNIETKKSDIFSNIKKSELFDIIYWNMPFIYIFKDYKYKSILERGLFDPGYKLTKIFLKDAKKHLKVGGKILVGTGNFGDIKRFKELAMQNNYKFKLLVREKAIELISIDFQLYELKKRLI